MERTELEKAVTGFCESIGNRRQFEAVEFIDYLSKFYSPRTEQLATLSEEYLNSLNVRDMTKIQYKRAFDMFFVFLKRQGIESPTESDMSLFTQYLSSAYKPASFSSYFSPLRAFFRWTNENKLYPDIVSDKKAGRFGEVNE